MIKHHHYSNIQSSRTTIFRVLRQISYTKLFKKYTSGNYSYHKILANNLIYNDTCRIVSRFKDYLILDDNTEFLRRFYYGEESVPRLEKILTFYEKYSKIFPNYMILKESKYLYRNIRKKQKMIDAVNEIKREEEENRKKMKQNNGKINKEKNELFTKKVKEEIKTFQENTTFEKYKNQFDSDNERESENSISISVMDRKKFFEYLDNKYDKEMPVSTEVAGEKSNSIFESFVANETNHSISGILNILNDNKIYINDLPKLLEINNYSKNSENIKNKQKKQSKTMKKSPDIKNTKNNSQLTSPIDKLEKKQNNKRSKKSEIQLKENNKKNISDSSNLINSNTKGNILSKKRFKKLSTPTTTSGTVLINNTEKNINELNQYQNIIIPKGNTVININNNYFEQIATSTQPMGYYPNQNFKINNNSNNNNNNNLGIKRTSTNNKYRNSKNNLIQTSAKKPQQQTNLFKNNNNNEEVIRNKNHNKRYHYKQISRDYIYQKNKNAKNVRCITTNENNEKIIKEKITKISSFSPQPIITSADIQQNDIKRLQLIKNDFKNDKCIYKNYLTENNDPNLITRNTKGNGVDEEEDNKEREKLFFHIKDLIEKKRKENNKNIILETENNHLDRKNNMKIKTNENEKKFDFNNFSKYKTISNFKGEKKYFKNKYSENNYEGNCYSKKEIKDMTSEHIIFQKKAKRINKDNLNIDIKNINNNKKEEEINKFQKINTKYGFRKLHIKEKKNKSKGIFNNTNINNNTIINNNCEKSPKINNNFLSKTNNNFKENKRLYNISNQDNALLKSNEKSKIVKKNKLLNQRNNQLVKNKGSEIQFEKGITTLSHSSILNKTSITQIKKLLMSHKKEEDFIGKNSTTKLFYKGRIKNMKYKKDDLNIDLINHNTNSNMNNYCINNLNNKIALTEHNIISTDNHNNHKGFISKYNINNSDIRDKYRSYLLKKNKQKSCELENQSSIQKKTNKELLQRMNLIKKNNKNNFYLKYRENKVKLGGIKSYIGKNISSFDNLSISNVHANSIGNVQNYARNTTHLDSIFQTPSVEKRKLGLYKKVMRFKSRMARSGKKYGDKSRKNFDTPSTIKVNRTKFLEKVKDKILDNNKVFTKNNFNSRFSHKVF